MRQGRDPQGGPWGPGGRRRQQAQQEWQRFLEEELYPMIGDARYREGGELKRHWDDFSDEHNRQVYWLMEMRGFSQEAAEAKVRAREERQAQTPRPTGMGIRAMTPAEKRTYAPQPPWPEMRAMTPEEKEYYDALTAHEEVLAAHRELHRQARALPTEKQWGDIIGPAIDVAAFGPRVIDLVFGAATGGAKGLHRERDAVGVAEEGVHGVGEALFPYLYGTWREALENQQAAYERGEGPAPDPVKLVGERFSEILEAPNALGWWPPSEDYRAIHEQALGSWRRLKMAEEKLKNQGRSGAGGGPQ